MEYSEVEKELDECLAKQYELTGDQWSEHAVQVEKSLTDTLGNSISRETVEGLVRLFAKSYVAYLKLSHVTQQALEVHGRSNSLRENYQKATERTFHNVAIIADATNRHIEALPAKVRSETAKKGGDISNEKNRKLHDAIRTSWATGNFSSRDICAQEEWQALGFGSQKAARNALLKTPAPSPWPAKK